jgi:outer membrane protein TolC
MEQWRIASADLTRILRLDRTARIEPSEPPHLQVTLVGLGQSVDDLIPIGLRNRPELASQRALVEAALLRLKAEKIRPLVPSVVLSGQGPGGSTVGVFGGGNTAMSNYGARSDFDVQVVWTFENLGLTNLSKIRERKADQRAAILQMFKVQDQVAAEVVQAYAQAWSAQARTRKAEDGLKDAVESLDKNFEGMKQTRLAGNLNILLIRPQEVVAAVQALANAYSDYYGAVADYNRSQFLLFRALGFPSQVVTGNEVRFGTPIGVEPEHHLPHQR